VDAVALQPSRSDATHYRASVAKDAYGKPVMRTVDGHDVRVSNPEKLYFPDASGGPITKLEVVDYYVAVGGAMLRALRGRPTTLERWPGGVVAGARLSTREGFKGEAFYQKRVPIGAPDWVRTARISFPSGRTADEICPNTPATMVWAAQLGTITFHPWPVRSPDVDAPDELRIDLDPQPGTDFADSVVVAQELHGLLDELGWIGFPKTSGGRGVHVYVRIQPRWTFTDVRHAAIAIGRELERRMPGRVTTKWWKEERGETVFVDYNQNARDRTIRSAWSLRAVPEATASTPLTWDELPVVTPLDFTLRTVPARLAEQGDPHAAIDDVAHDLTPVLEWYERDERDHGLGDMPYPPDYPKMPGEPPRVQPSRQNLQNWDEDGTRRDG
jgi:DNA ligase D